MLKITKLCFRVCFNIIVLFAIFAVPIAAHAQEAPKCRALLISCERFVTAPGIAPAGLHNLDMLETVLAQDLRGFEISRQYGITSSKEALDAAIKYAFKDAQEGDLSFLYICTHGEFDPAKDEDGYLLLSDGSLEDRVSAAQLEAMLHPVPGIKMLLVDACNSGALIHKGTSPSVDVTSPHFQSDDYKVLLSSGANESSWYWRSWLDNAPPGSSYFTTALALGAGLIGSFPADANHDGVITLQEMYQYLWVNQASSTVQMYPQDDAFPFIVYDRSLLQENQEGELIGFVFPNTTLDPTNPVLTFQYTARTETRVFYLIAHLQNGVWNWNQAVIPDDSEFDGDGDPMGDITPGRKEVKLDLSEILPADWTYAMVHVMTRGDRASDKKPFIYASRVLSARRDQNPNLFIQAAPKWERVNGSEFEFFVGHTIPCSLTVQIQDEQGALIRKICVSQPTRPQVLTPEGSLFYWNGLSDQGIPVPAGTYHVVATTRLNGTRYEAQGEVIITSVR